MTLDFIFPKHTLKYALRNLVHKKIGFPGNIYFRILRRKNTFSISLKFSKQEISWKLSLLKDIYIYFFNQDVFWKGETQGYSNMN